MTRWLAVALALAALAAAPRSAAADSIAQYVTQYANTTIVPASQCEGIWQDALDAGNCSRSACNTSCLQSLATVRHPLGGGSSVRTAAAGGLFPRPHLAATSAAADACCPAAVRPQVPLSCVPTIVNDTVNVNTTLGDVFDDT